MRSFTVPTCLAALLLVGWAAPVPAQADSPRAALETYLAGLKTGNVGLVLSVYHFGDRRPDYYLPGPIPIESHRITKELVFDTIQARRHNTHGVIPPAQAGDVELQVEERISGHGEMYTYWLRLIDGHWRIYAHTAWNAPD